MKNSNYFLLITFFIILFITGIMETIISGIMQELCESFSTNDSTIGQLISKYSLVFAFICPILVFLFRKINIKKSILLFLLIFSVGNLFMSISKGLPMLFASRIITAIGASLLVTKILESCFLIFENDKKKLSIVNIGFSSSIAIGVPLGTFISNQFGWQLIFGGTFIISIFLLFNILFFYPNSIKEGEKKKSKLKLQSSSVKLLFSTMFILLSNMLFIGYISVFLKEKNFISPEELLLVLVSLGIGGILGSWISSYFMEKMTVKNSLIFLLIIFSVSLILLNFSSNYLLSLIIFFIWSLSQWSTGPIIQYGLANSAANTFREQLISLNVSFLNIGSGLGAILGGIFLSYFSSLFLPLIALFFGILALIIVLSLKE